MKLRVKQIFKNNLELNRFNNKNVHLNLKHKRILILFTWLKFFFTFFKKSKKLISRYYIWIYKKLYRSFSKFFFSKPSVYFSSLDYHFLKTLNNYKKKKFFFIFKSKDSKKIYKKYFQNYLVINITVPLSLKNIFSSKLLLEQQKSYYKIDILKHKDNNKTKKYSDSLIYYNYIYGREKFLKKYKFFKKKFLIFRKFVWFYMYWNTIISKNHQIMAVRNDLILKTINYWPIFEINDENLIFRSKMDDGIGNDWIFITYYTKAVSTLDTDKKLWRIRIRNKRIVENYFYQKKSEAGFLRKKKIQLIRTKKYKKRLASLIDYSKIREANVRKLRDDIYYRVTGKRLFSYYSKEKDFFFFKNYFLNRFKFFFKKKIVRKKKKILRRVIFFF